MSVYEKPYAIVRFLENDTYSEVPSNWIVDDNDKTICWWPVKVRNVTSCILNRTSPDKTTWESCEVEIEQFCDTWEKARKIVDNPLYKTTDDENLGKGCRIKIGKNKYSSSSESVESEINEKKINMSTNKGKIKATKSKPKVTSCISIPPNLDLEKLGSSAVIFDGNLNVMDTVELALSTENNNIHQGHNSNKMLETEFLETSDKLVNDIIARNCYKKVSTATVLKCANEKNRNEEIEEKLLEEIITIKEQCSSICRMHASLIVQLKSIDQRLSKMERKSSIPVNETRYNLIETFLPLKDIDNIKNFENFLSTNNEAVHQYRNFLSNIGGHTIKDNIHRILRKVFADDSAKFCSWKGKKNNFAVYNLQIIKEIQNAISSSHESMTELHFEETAAEWFRFAKQRARKNKEN